MNLDKLFHVLVVTGAASTAGLAGCGGDGDNDGGTAGSAGSTSTGGGTSTGGTPGTGGSGGTSAGGSSMGGSSMGGAAGGGDMCEQICMPSAEVAAWTDCGGCCCWLPVGTNAPIGSPTCGEEPCCVGRGR